jgi:GNAT superfamily N-acetyltransferase
MLTFDGYRPGSLAATVALHAEYYAREWRFGLPFEAKVASEMAEFLTRMDAGRDLFLTAWNGDVMVGTVTVDVTGGGEGGAHLRWFIVSDAARGTGLGGALISQAIAFCDERDVPRIWLTTFAGLDAAAALYERHGFTLITESDLDQWSGGVRERLYARVRPLNGR